jgi:hypothetical protein
MFNKKSFLIQFIALEIKSSGIFTHARREREKRKKDRRERQINN